VSLNPYEDVLFFYDGTFFESGKKGFLVTSKRLVVFDRSQVREVDFSDIKDVSHEWSDKRKAIRLKLASEELLLLLNYVQRNQEEDVKSCVKLLRARARIDSFDDPVEADGEAVPEAVVLWVKELALGRVNGLGNPTVWAVRREKEVLKKIHELRPLKRKLYQRAYEVLGRLERVIESLPHLNPNGPELRSREGRKEWERYYSNFTPYVREIEKIYLAMYIAPFIERSRPGQIADAVTAELHHMQPAVRDYYAEYYRPFHGHTQDALRRGRSRERIVPALIDQGLLREEAETLFYYLAYHGENGNAG
jgi:hypothetical protein